MDELSDHKEGISWELMEQILQRTMTESVLESEEMTLETRQAFQELLVAMRSGASGFLFSSFLFKNYLCVRVFCLHAYLCTCLCPVAMDARKEY